jgi:hypothetical protein
MCILITIRLALGRNIGYKNYQKVSFRTKKCAKKPKAEVTTHLCGWIQRPKSGIDIWRNVSDECHML